MAEKLKSVLLCIKLIAMEANSYPLMRRAAIRIQALQAMAIIEEIMGESPATIRSDIVTSNNGSGASPTTHQPDERTYHRVIDILKKHIKPKCYRATDDPNHYPTIPEIDFCTAASIVMREFTLPVRESGTQALETVAKIAATCMIDLRCNLKEARQEWMDGRIAKGAYEYVQMRHDNLHIALKEAGFTEQHKLFDCPVRPAVPDVEGGHS